jgi:Putative DNA-binding domain
LSSAHDREALRQQMLLRALWGDARPGVVAGWLRDGARTPRGLSAYRANAAAAAERALATAYPTVQQLLGAESFTALARALWLRHPPTAGDLGLWGGELAAFIADAESLAEEPYLPDVARLEWAVHLAERAADAGAPAGLEQLAEVDPEQLCIDLAPGTAVLLSEHPITSIHAAHRSSAVDRFDAVRAAFAAGRGECARVARQGWPAVVTCIESGEARFTQALLEGRSLAAALGAAQQAGDFDFESWLIDTLRRGGLAAVRHHKPEEHRT